jgi:hypothetical protein
VFQRSIKIYAGVDNLIQFQIKNADSKSVNVTGWTINFNLVSKTESSLLCRKQSKVINAQGGIITVMINERDLLNLRNGFYSYSLTATDQYGSEQVFYVDSNFGACGEIELLSGPYPEFRESINVTIPTNSNSTVYSSWVTSDQNSISQSAHHTIQFFFNNFSGNLIVQGTIDSLPPNGDTGGSSSLSWANVVVTGSANISSNGSTLHYINQFSTDYCDFNGVYTACRVYIIPENVTISSTSVTKILYRG